MLIHAALFVLVLAGSTPTRTPLPVAPDSAPRLLVLLRDSLPAAAPDATVRARYRPAQPAIRSGKAGQDAPVAVPERTLELAPFQQASPEHGLRQAAMDSAGLIDRELREGRLAAIDKSSASKLSTLGVEIEKAYIDLSTYERRGRFAPDESGVVYYSMTRRGKTTCVMSGLSGPPRAITCPTGAASWQNY
ncbi:MAG: hypothetical protein V4633_19615 [Pseudomonadota bacterium]